MSPYLSYFSVFFSWRQKYICFQIKLELPNQKNYFSALAPIIYYHCFIINSYNKATEVSLPMEWKLDSDDFSNIKGN